MFVAPHAIRALWPRTTPGTPGNETPATSYGQAVDTVRQCSPLRYQIDGIEMPRCGSFASSAPRLADMAGPTTQSLEPIPWSEARPAAASNPAVWRRPWPRPATACQAAASSGPREGAVAGWRTAVVSPGAAVVPVEPEPVGGFARGLPAPPDPGRPVGVMIGAPSR